MNKALLVGLFIAVRALVKPNDMTIAIATHTHRKMFSRLDTLKKDCSILSFLFGLSKVRFYNNITKILLENK
jgi:hypothetical protein